MQKKYIFIPLIALTLLATPVLAVTNGSDTDVTDNLKKRLQSSLESPSPIQESNNRAYVGIVKDIIKDTVIMEDKEGKKDIKLKDASVIVRSPGNATIKAEDIRIDDSIIAIGVRGENNVFTALRLIVSADPIKPPAKISNLGVITKIGKNALTLKLKDQDQILTLSPKTILKSPSGIIELSDLAVGDTLIYTALIEEKLETATLIMRIKTSSL